MVCLRVLVSNVIGHNASQFSEFDSKTSDKTCDKIFSVLTQKGEEVLEWLDWQKLYGMDACVEPVQGVLVAGAKEKNNI